MKTMILAAMLVAIPLAAQAEATTINRETETVCKRYRHRLACETHTETVIETPKRRPPPEPERPMLPPSVERTGSGVLIMRGMPLR